MAGRWQAVTNQPRFQTSTMILLTDGRVMVQEEATNHWHALTPVGGDYINGAWLPLADMNFWRRYYASGVLKDGRVILCGGEQSAAGDDTADCQIFDPAAAGGVGNWVAIASPTTIGWTQVGDAVCCVLPDGRFMLGNIGDTSCAIYDPMANVWSLAAAKAVRSNEETWILLSDDTILTAQCFPPYNAEKYLIASNTWKNEGALPVVLVDPNMSEIGPAMLLYNAKVIYFGAQNDNGKGKTAIYTPPATPAGTGTWIAGPDIPKVGGLTMVCNDCPAALLPNGKVLFTAADYRIKDWGSPIFFFEYDPTANTISQAPSPPNNAAQLFWSRLMLLPSGQVLFSPSTNNIQCYTPDGSPQETWRPTINSIAATSATTFLLRGTQLNGLSQANIYGDDCYPATNFPLVQLRDITAGSITFGRTFDFSTMGVATGAAVQSLRFSIPAIPKGSYDVFVIANGISSRATRFNI